MNLVILFTLGFLLIISLQYKCQNENFSSIFTIDSTEVEPEDPESIQKKIKKYHEQTVELDNILEEKLKKKQNQKCSRIYFSRTRDNQFPQLKNISSGFECVSKKGTWYKKHNLCCGSLSAEKLKELSENRKKIYEKRIKNNENSDSSGYSDLDEDENDTINGVSKSEFINSNENIQKALLFNNPQFMEFYNTTS